MSPPSTSSPWRALRHRNFALFFIGHGLSLCGTWMQTLAQAWLVYRLTESPLMLGLVEFLMRAPILLLSVAGGVMADRWSRHRLLLLTQALSLLQASALAGLTLSGHVTIDWVLWLAALLGIINALDIPIRQAFVGELVPRDELPSAIGLNSSIFNGARIVGPSLAGMLVLLVGEGICFLINAASYLILLGGLLLMRGTSGGSGAATLRAWGFLREGFGYAWQTREVRALLTLIMVLSIAAAPYATLLPVFAGDILKVGPAGFGGLMAATGVGALAGAFGIARRGSVVGLGSRIGVAVLLYAVGLLTLAVSATLWLSLPALVSIGFGMITSLAATNTLLQSIVPDQLRGRVMSFYATVSLGFTTFGSLAAGAGGTHLGAPLTVGLGGLVTLLTAVLFWKTSVTRLDRRPVVAAASDLRLPP